MLVKFLPTGQVLDTNFYTFQVGPSTAARTPVVLDTNPADIAYIGKRVSGTPLAITGYSAYACIQWKSKNGQEIRWKMDSVAAAATGRDNLLAAYSNAPAADVSVSLSSAGAVVAL